MDPCTPCLYSIYKSHLCKGESSPVLIVELSTEPSQSWWINVWTSSSTSRAQIAHHSTLITTSTADQTGDIGASSDVFFYLAIYVTIPLFACIVGTARLFVVVLASLASSRVLFRNLLSAVLRAPLQWSDTVPLGRILNRFTSDLYMVDLRLYYDLANFTAKVLEFLAILAAGVLLSPPLTVIALFLLVFCIKLSFTFLEGAQVIQRLESVARSPLFEPIDSSLAGSQQSVHTGRPQIIAKGCTPASIVTLKHYGIFGY